MNDWTQLPVADIGKLAKLREPFPAHQISKLPKPFKSDSPKGTCKECGGYHGLPAMHLDYVGHAALTDRLLDTDPAWYWEPLAFKDGLPAFDATGGLWIKLTLCGVTRLGYGNAAGKSYMDVGAREKEVIGDALRNAAMRFGAALDLWHKGDLHVEEEPKSENKINHETGEIKPSRITPNDGSMQNLSPQEQNNARILASNIVGFWKEGRQEEAYSEFYENELNNEMQMAVWQLLKPQSALRTELTKIRNQKKEVA